MLNTNFSLVKLGSLVVLLVMATSGMGQTECNMTSHIGVNFGPNADDQMYDVKVQTDGKFVAFGSTYYISSNTFEISICRFMPKEGIDTTFGTKGKASYKFDSRNTCYAGAIRSDGKIYAGGYQAPGNGLSTFRPYVARFTANGVIDSTFGTNGSARINTLGVASVIGLQPVANQKVLVAMIRRSPASVAIARLKNDGTFDSTFATNGVTTHTIPNLAYQVNYGQALFKSNGKMVIIGKTLVPTNPYVVQFNADGSLDTNFANKGVLVIPRNITYNFSNIHGTLDNQERILVGATATAPSKFALWRLQHNGLVDSTFGVNGLSLAKSTNFSSARGIAVHPNDSTIIQYGLGGVSGRFPSLFYNDANGHPIGGCKNDTFEVFNLGYAFGHYFTNATYDHLNNLRFFGLTGQKEVAGGGAENSNFLRISNECLTVVDSTAEVSCFSYTSPSGDSTWTTSGIYLDTLPNPNQCNLDSIIIIDLTINEVDVSVTRPGGALIANATNATYQWVDCDSGYAVLPNDTDQTFMPQRDGNYAVIVESMGCVDTSDCYIYITPGIDDLGAKNHVKIYPNPASDLVQIDLSKTATDIRISFYDITGKEQYRYTQATGQLISMRPELQQGVYMVHIQTSKSNSWKKLVME